MKIERNEKMTFKILKGRELNFFFYAFIFYDILK